MFAWATFLFGQPCGCCFIEYLIAAQSYQGHHRLHQQEDTQKDVIAVERIRYHSFQPTALLVHNAPAHYSDSLDCRPGAARLTD